MLNKPYSTSDSYNSWTKIHDDYDEQHKDSLTMSNSPPWATTEKSDNTSPPQLEVSATQRMLSAVIGSLVTSLLGKQTLI